MAAAHARIEIDGELDGMYLNQALRRAGERVDVGEIEVEALLDGRTGARVHRLTTDAGSFVLKRAPLDSWQFGAMANPGEGRLWLSGVLDSLPAPLECPIIDAAFHRPAETWWILMRDVSDGIPPRGAFGEAETLALWRAMAGLHGAWWDRKQSLDALPLIDIAPTTALFAEPVASAAGRAEVREGWVPRVVEEFMPLRVLLPLFLELLAPADADFYIALTRDRDWHHGLDEATPTMLHGDLRRANISFMGGKVVLFDWEFATRGPAACDLQWNAFLTFWAYNPDDGKEPWERDHLKQAYLDELEACIGRGIDRAEFEKTWELGWVRAVSQIGFCFADADLDDPDERAAALNRATEGIRRCRRILGG